MTSCNVGKDNPNWKEGKVSYETIHGYVRRRLPKPDACASCHIEKDKLDLCFKDHMAGRKNQNYTRNLSDWVWLCRSCHMKADGRTKKLIGCHAGKPMPKERLIKLRAGYDKYFTPEKRKEVNAKIRRGRWGL